MQPYLRDIPRNVQVVDNFRGYNHNLRIADNEFYDSENLSSDDAPVLSVRKARSRLNAPTGKNVCGLFVTKGNVKGQDPSYVSYAYDFTSEPGTRYVHVVYNNDDYGVAMNFTGSTGVFPKRTKYDLIARGGSPLIFNTYEGSNGLNGNNAAILKRAEPKSRFESIDTGITFSTNPATITNCDMNGIPLKIKYEGVSAPSDAKDGDLWIDSSEEKISIKKYSISARIWVALPNTYLKIERSDGGKQWGSGLNIGDGVEVSGSSTDFFANGYNVIVNGSFTDDEGTRYWDYIVITGVMNSKTPAPDTIISLHRKCPVLQFATEANNRVWICEDSDNGGRLVASALGDAANWYRFEGSADDSYFAEIGSPGLFTGSATFQNKPHFFKEDAVYVVSGVNPPFSIKEIKLHGVQYGCCRSVVEINGFLYYKSRDGIYKFDGAAAVKVSNEFGKESYSDAVAGKFQDKYYVNMKDSNGDYHIFVYDTKKLSWTRENGEKIVQMASGDYALYAYVDDEEGKVDIITDDGINNQDEMTQIERTVPWYAETGILSLENIYHKYISKITVRMRLALNSQVKILIRYDESKKWEQVCVQRSSRLNSFDIPIRIKRCDHMQLRFEGIGDAWIYSIAKTIQGGSEYR